MAEIEKYRITTNKVVCQMCGSMNIRGGYHEYQNLDSYICKNCGIRWLEDSANHQYHINDNRRFVWVLHKTANYNPIRDARSADEVSFENFG